MLRPRPTYIRVNPVFPEDFPERLERLKEASGLSWHQIALALGTTPSVMREWRSGNKRPSPVYLVRPIHVRRQYGARRPRYPAAWNGHSTGP